MHNSGYKFVQFSKEREFMVFIRFSKKFMNYKVVKNIWIKGFLRFLILCNSVFLKLWNVQIHCWSSFYDKPRL